MKTLSSVLLRTLLVGMLPLLILFGAFALENFGRHKANSVESVTSLAGSFALTLNDQINLRASGLKVLAESPLIEAMNLDELYRQASVFHQTFGSHVVFADVTGERKMIFNTLRPLGTELPNLPIPAKNSAVTRALQTLAPAAGDSFDGPVVNQRLVALAAPGSTEGDVKYMMLTLFSIDYLQKLLDQLNLPKHWRARIVDGSGYTLAESEKLNWDLLRDEMIAAQAPLDAAPWFVEVAVPTATLLSSLYWELLVTFFAFAVAGVLGWVLARSQYKVVVKDFGRLVSGSDSDENLSLVEADIIEDRLIKGGQELRATQGTLLALIEQSPVGIAMFDRELNFLASSARWLSYFDLGPDLPSLKLDQVLTSESDIWRDRLKRALAGETFGETAELYTYPDGERRWTEWELQPWYKGGDTPAGITLFWCDVHERVQSEQQLRDAAAIFNSTHEGLLITDTAGRVVTINRAFTAITGYTVEEMRGHTMSLLKSGRHDDLFYATMWRQITQADHWHGEIWNRAKSGKIYPEQLTISAIRDDSGKLTGYAGIFSDLTPIKEREERLQHLVLYDQLTDLPNRSMLEGWFAQAKIQTTAQSPVIAVCILDIDRFKSVNDSIGHGAADVLLTKLSQRLNRLVGGDSSVGRLGGDEFCILLQGLSGPLDAANTIDTILEQIHNPIRVAEKSLSLTASVGIAIYPNDGTEFLQLMQYAETAMYEAKSLGRNCYQFYAPAMAELAIQYGRISNELHKAIPHRQLYLVYQPQVELSSNRLVGVEVLLRWQHPELGLVSPGRFIPIAEENGMIREIGEWVFKEACLQARRWLKAGVNFGRLAINVAGPQLYQAGYLDTLKASLEETGVSGEHFALEVTEGFLMRDPATAIELLSGMRNLGFELAMDDFGTGYSSLSYLRTLPLDKLKIDQSFVRDLLDDTNARAIAEVVISIGNALNMTVIAEGVELREQAELLRDLGCQQAQGYLYAQPLVVSDFEAWVNAQTGSGEDLESAE